ncbi:hypothetical protein D3C80_1123590 [compost metagenome]
MAEQLGLEQLLGDRRAVESDKGLAGARAKLMQAARDLLLAAAGFAANQHVDRQAGEVQDLLAQLLHALGHAQQIRLQAYLQIGLFMQAAVLQHQLAFFQGAAQAAEQGFGAEGLFKKVVGAIAHGLDRHRHIAMAGEQDHRQVGIAGLQLFEQLQAVHAGHAHITEDHPGEVHRQLLQAVFGTAEQLHVEAGQAQPLLYGGADAGFIVDDHH